MGSFQASEHHARPHIQPLGLVYRFATIYLKVGFAVHVVSQLIELFVANHCSLLDRLNLKIKLTAKKLKG